MSPAGRVLAAAAVVLGLASGCTARAPAGTAQGPAGLHEVRPCPGLAGFSCGSLSVRLDPFGPAPGRLSLRVALSDVAAAPRGVLAAQGCAADPAADLAVVVRRYHDGPALLDTLVALSIGVPSFPGVPAALHTAAAGRPAAPDTLMARVHAAQSAPAGYLSQGLHASTLCADLPMPWGGPETPLAARPAALARAAARLTTAQVWPFDRATAAGNGIIQTCLYWPPTPTPSPGPAGTGPRAELPRVPVLLLAGSHDLSTPLSGAQAQAARAPDGRLFVVPGAGHSVQSRAPGDAAQAEVARFLA